MATSQGKVKSVGRALHSNCALSDVFVDLLVLCNILPDATDVGIGVGGRRRTQAMHGVQRGGDVAGHGSGRHG